MHILYWMYIRPYTIYQPRPINVYVYIYIYIYIYVYIYIYIYVDIFNIDNSNATCSTKSTYAQPCVHNRRNQRNQRDQRAYMQHARACNRAFEKSTARTRVQRDRRNQHKCNRTYILHMINVFDVLSYVRCDQHTYNHASS